jgi:hypothetical protein
MKFKLFCALLALAVPAAIFAAPAPDGKSSALTNAVILVIRHAEKPDTGDNLTPAGEARARAYAGYFKNFTLDGQPLKLDHLFAATDSAKSRRPRLTLEPTARELGLKIDSRFTDKKSLALASELQSHPTGTNILVCWRHEGIPQLLQALDADPKKLLPGGKWPDDEYDWLIELRFDENGRLIDSKRINENLTPAVAGKPAPAAP